MRKVYNIYRKIGRIVLSEEARNQIISDYGFSTEIYVDTEGEYLIIERDFWNLRNGKIEWRNELSYELCTFSKLSGVVKKYGRVEFDASGKEYILEYK